MRNRRLEDRMEDFGDLLAARTADELHRALVLRRPMLAEREPSLAVELIRMVHAQEPDALADSLLLLATDPRWRSAAMLFLRAVESAGLVPDDVANHVAELVVAADDHVVWICPDAWFKGGLVVEIDFGGERGGDHRAGVAEGGAVEADSHEDEHQDQDQDQDQDEEEGTMSAVTWRDVPEGTRRWAVARLLRLEPHRWPAMLERATSPTVSRALAAGALLGLLDAVDLLPVEALAVIEGAAISFGEGKVRLAGLAHLAQRDPDTARTIGASDPSAKVRARAATFADINAPRPLADQGATFSRQACEQSSPTPGQGDQLSLF